MGFSLRLQRFCCCCSLRMGTLVIGTLGWLWTLLQISMTAEIMHQGYNDEYGYSEGNHSMKYFSIRRTFACITLLLVHVLLIVGVYKKNNKFMMPWLVLHCLKLIVIWTGSFIYFGVIFFVASSLTALFIGLTIVLFLMGWLEWYYWICVWSHYMELNDRDAVVSPNVEYSPTHVSPPPYSKADVPLV